MSYPGPPWWEKESEAKRRLRRIMLNEAVERQTEAEVQAIIAEAVRKILTLLQERSR